MKSRVERFKALHEKIDNTIDESNRTKELSSFANRLNKIDEQFEKMDVPISDDKPSHARSFQSEEESIFDTFENEYLKDFLDEVKAYNVEKGYRSEGDTQSNILKELQSDVKSIDNIDTTSITTKDTDTTDLEEWHNFTRRNRFVTPDDEVRDIHEEVLALTQELTVDEVEVERVSSLTEIKPIPVEEVEILEEAIEESIVENRVVEAVVPPIVEEIVIEEVVSNEGILETVKEATVGEVVVPDIAVVDEKPEISKQDAAIFEGFYEEPSAYSTKQVRKSRFLNTAINLLLVTLVLGVAIAVKVFVLK